MNIRRGIKKYTEKIKSFNLLNYVIKKRIELLQGSKKLQEDMILFFKTKIEEKKTEEKSLQGKILHARNLIVGYIDQLDKLDLIVELYN